MLNRVATKPRPPGRRPLSSETRAGLGAAFVLIALVSAVELADGSRANFIGLLAAAPFLAAAFASWRQVLTVGAVAVVVGLAFAVPRGSGSMLAIGINLGGGIFSTPAPPPGGPQP